MTHRCGSSGVRVAKLSTIHLTVAMDMPRKPFEANTNTRRVMVKTSFEIVEQNQLISVFIPLACTCTTDLSQIFREPPGARKERYCEVSCVSDAILSIIGKSRLSLTFLPKTIMAPYCHFGD